MVGLSVFRYKNWYILLPLCQAVGNSGIKYGKQGQGLLVRGDLITGSTPVKANAFLVVRDQHYTPRFSVSQILNLAVSGRAVIPT